MGGPRVRIRLPVPRTSGATRPAGPFLPWQARQGEDTIVRSDSFRLPVEHLMEGQAAAGRIGHGMGRKRGTGQWVDGPFEAELRVEALPFELLDPGFLRHVFDWLAPSPHPH